MRRLILALGVALLVLASATASHANMFVSISDGTTTRDGKVIAGQGGLVLRKASPAPTTATDVTDTLTVLTCAARPCTVHFPSGAATPQAGDTFRIQDVSAASLARVEKFDSVASADRVSFKGVKVTSLVAGRVLTINYGVQAGDLRTLTSTSTSYTGTAALTGTFKTVTGLRATACKAGLTAADVADSCVKLSVALNGTTVNGAGTTAVATVSVPCNNAFPTVNPCGTNGSYVSALGSFTGVNDVKSISCASPCRPTQVGTVTAEFNGTGDVLQLIASANGGMANISDEQGGLEEVFLTLADELGTNRWVSYTAVTEPCQAVPRPPISHDTRNVPNNANIPIKFELWCGHLAPVPAGSGLELVSIVDPAEGVLAGSASTRNDAARVGFLAAPGLNAPGLKVKDINVLSLSYEVVVGTAPSGNGTLGDLNFTDCTAGSFRVELELRDSYGAPAGIAKVYLGSDPYDDFKSGCTDFVGTDLVNDPKYRVDTSGLFGYLAKPCCITFQKLKMGNTGKLVVRRISVIVDQGLPPASPANHKVVFFDGNVNGTTAFSTEPSTTALQTVTDLVQSFDLSTTGVSIVIQKLTGQDPGIVKIIRSQDIAIHGHKFQASVRVPELRPESGARYTISLCVNGAESDAGADGESLVAPGLCIPEQAFMTLK